MWLWLLVFAISAALVTVLLLYFRRLHYTQQSGIYDITELAYASPDRDGDLCLTNKETPNRKFCIHTDPDSITLDIYVNNIRSFALTFPPIDQLPADEERPSEREVLGARVGLFRHPFADDTVCIRDMSDLSYPQRLCYKINGKKAYLSHPIDNHYLSS